MSTERPARGFPIGVEKRQAPLRRIIERLHTREQLFERHRVLLECGHEAASNATYRARCVACKEQAAR